MSQSLFLMAIFTAATVHMALGDGTCVSGVTFSGFANTILNGDYIGSGRTDGVRSSYFLKDNAHEYGHLYWILYESKGYDGATQTRWSIYTSRASQGDADKLLAWCVPGVDGCPEGTPSMDAVDGKIWPSSVGSMKWNVNIDGKTTLNSGISASCCKWVPIKCDSCKCTASVEPKFICNSGCGKDCCQFTSARFGLGRCNDIRTRRHCDHSSPSTKAVADSKQSELTVTV